MGRARKTAAKAAPPVAFGPYHTVIIPKPPSVNAMYANVSDAARATAIARGRKPRGRKKTGEAHVWSAEAAWEILRTKPPRMERHYELVIELGRRAGTDLGNYEKAVSDLLQAMGIVRNDSLCEDLRIKWAADLPSTKARISWRAVTLEVAHVR